LTERLLARGFPGLGIVYWSVKVRLRITSQEGDSWNASSKALIHWMVWLVAVAAFLFMVAAAAADRAPTRAEYQRIAEAAKRSSETQGVRSKFRVRHVRISTKGPWARAALPAKPRYIGTVQGSLAIFRRGKGSAGVCWMSARQALAAVTACQA
jgi:hypothetical protein